MPEMAVIYVLHVLKLQLWLRNGPVSKSFLLRNLVVDILYQ